MLSSFSPVPMNLMGLPVTALTERAAPPRASPSSLESVLAGHGVHHQEDLGGLDGGFDGFQLVHQRLVHVEPSGGVQEDHVVAVADGVGHGGLGDVHGIGLAHLEDGDIQLFTHHLQLLDGGGAVDVAGHQQRAAALLFEEAGQLGAVGGLAGALETHQHHNRGRLGGHAELLVFAAHQGGQLFVDDLDDHLGRREAFEHVAADGALRDLGDKVLDDLVADVGFQKRQTDFPHGGLDVGFGEAALAPELLEGSGDFFGQTFKCHVLLLYGCGGGQDGLCQGFRLGLLQERGSGGGDLLQRLLLPSGPGHAADLFFHGFHGAFRPGEDVVDGLARDPCLLGDFPQGEILIVVEVEAGALLLGQEFSVVVQQQGHFQGVVLHGGPCLSRGIT